MTPIPAVDARLVASTRLHGDPDRVATLLGEPEVSWPGGRVPHPESGDLRRFAIDLRLRVGVEAAAVTTFRKAAFLDLGWPHRTATGWTAEIGWRAASAAPLFPVFSGQLTIEPDTLRIDGLYAPPGGVVGRVADRVLLHVAANATARWLLTEINAAAAERG